MSQAISGRACESSDRDTLLDFVQFKSDSTTSISNWFRRFFGVAAQQNSPQDSLFIFSLSPGFDATEACPARVQEDDDLGTLQGPSNRA